ncbi:MAG: hypothetical protein HY000_12170 [Planctomycetes bacterium]|nr:hypothetical protein [Planctomycetota bacterium]
MLHHLARKPLVLLVVVPLTAIFLARVCVALWLWERTSRDFLWHFVEWEVADSLFTAAVLAAVGVVSMRLVARASRQDRDIAKRGHLVEVGLLARGLAHEVRNSLNAIRTRIALLRKLPSGASGEVISERINALEQPVAELDELVREFLAFARPAKDELEEVQFDKLLHEVLEFAGLDLAQGQVTLETQLAPDLPPVYVDADKLRRVLLNLVINARQSMAEGGRLIVRARPLGRRHVVIEVSDTGCGIPESDRPHIFESFFTTKHDGTGLGLAIVRRTIEDFGGRVSFDSTVGQGTTFRIKLPTAQQRCGTLKREVQMLAAADSSGH